MIPVLTLSKVTPAPMAKAVATMPRAEDFGAVFDLSVIAEPESETRGQPDDPDPPALVEPPAIAQMMPQPIAPVIEGRPDLPDEAVQQIDGDPAAPPQTTTQAAPQEEPPITPPSAQLPAGLVVFARTLSAPEPLLPDDPAEPQASGGDAEPDVQPVAAEAEPQAGADVSPDDADLAMADDGAETGVPASGPEGRALAETGQGDVAKVAARQLRLCLETLRPDLAQPNVAPSSETAIEVIFAPEELGRVQLSLTPDGEVMRVHLLAERSETLDLLRRNADQLAQEFLEAGFAQSEMTFGQWGQDGPAAQDKTAPVAAPALPAPPGDRALQTAQVSPGSGLNLRL